MLTVFQSKLSSLTSTPSPNSQLQIMRINSLAPAAFIDSGQDLTGIGGSIRRKAEEISPTPDRGPPAPNLTSQDDSSAPPPISRYTNPPESETPRGVQGPPKASKSLHSENVSTAIRKNLSSYLHGIRNSKSPTSTTTLTPLRHTHPTPASNKSAIPSIWNTPKPPIPPTTPTTVNSNSSSTDSINNFNEDTPSNTHTASTTKGIILAPNGRLRSKVHTPTTKTAPFQQHDQNIDSPTPHLGDVLLETPNYMSAKVSTQQDKSISTAAASTLLLLQKNTSTSTQTTASLNDTPIYQTDTITNRQPNATNMSSESNIADDFYATSNTNTNTQSDKSTTTNLTAKTFASITSDTTFATTPDASKTTAFRPDPSDRFRSDLSINSNSSTESVLSMTPTNTNTLNTHNTSSGHQDTARSHTPNPYAPAKPTSEANTPGANTSAACLPSSIQADNAIDQTTPTTSTVTPTTPITAPTDQPASKSSHPITSDFSVDSGISTDSIDTSALAHLIPKPSRDIASKPSRHTTTLPSKTARPPSPITMTPTASHVQPPIPSNKQLSTTQRQISLADSFARALKRNNKPKDTTPTTSTTARDPILPTPARQNVPRTSALRLPHATITPNNRTSGTKTTSFTLPPTSSDRPNDMIIDDDPPDLTATEQTDSLLHVRMKPIRKSTRKSKVTTSGDTEPAASAPTTPAPPVPTNTPSSRRSKHQPPPPPPPPAVIKHSHKAVIILSVKIKNPTDTLASFIEQLCNVLDFFHEHVDATTAFLPKITDPAHPPITNQQSFPTVQFVLYRHYFDCKNPFAFGNTVAGKIKMIKVSATLGMMEDPKPILDAVRGDLNTFDVFINYKPLQELDTVNRILFLGAPQNANKKEFEETAYQILSDVERGLRNSDPDTYPYSVHGGEFPRFAIVSEQPGGMPYDEQTGKDKQRTGPPKAQRTIQMQCSTKDYDRIATVVFAAKEQKKWIKAFGLSCHPAETPSNDSTEGERQRFVQMVEAHVSVQLSFSIVPISGLRYADRQIQLRKLPDADNRPQPSVSLSIKDILFDMKFQGKRLWSCILKGDNGRYQGYFPGGDAILTAYVQAFLTCPAAQVYYYLLKRGFMKRDIDSLIRTTFNFEQQGIIAETKYNRHTRLAYIKARKDEHTDIIQFVNAADSGVDPTAGLSESQKKLRQAQQEAIVGPLKAGDVNYYNFDEGQSITTIHSKKARNADDGTVTSRSLGNTQFEPEDSDDSDFSDGDISAEDTIDKLIEANEPTFPPRRSPRFEIDLSDMEVDPMPTNDPTATPNDVGLAGGGMGEDTLDDDEEEENNNESLISCLMTSCSGSLQQMRTVVNILLTEMELKPSATGDTTLSDSVPTRFRELVYEEFRGDYEPTQQMLMSLIDSITEAEKEEQELPATQTDANGFIIYEIDGEDDEIVPMEFLPSPDSALHSTYSYPAGHRPASWAASAANTSVASATTTSSKPRGCTAQIGTSRPGVGQC